MTDSSLIRVLIIGAGPVGLINARTLIEDGCFDVTLVAKEEKIGGTWAHTYPRLKTNNPWHAMIFSGLDMPRPKGMSSSGVPAETYRRYLEDFYRYFVKDKARVLFNTEVLELRMNDEGESGWTAVMRDATDSTSTESFDKVILATSTLGKPIIPSFLKNLSLPIFHSSQLSHSSTWDNLLSTTRSTSFESLSPTTSGDGDTICVIGGGKSGTDIATSLSTSGRKVVIVQRGPKWYLPAVDTGPPILPRQEVYFGPSQVIDTWSMWFFHCTAIGAKKVWKFWTTMVGFTKAALYDNDKIRIPQSELFEKMPYFAGGLGLGPNDFRALVSVGKIAVAHGTVFGSTDRGVTIASITDNGAEIKPEEIHCSAVVVATGWSDQLWEFINPKLQYALGLTPRPPRQEYEQRVKTIRKKWSSVTGTKIDPVPMPMVYRGILPVGRWKQKDLVVAGGTRPFLLPAMVYEVESHWIASLFNKNTRLHPKLPPNERSLIEATHIQNEYLLARYPGYDLSERLIYSTFFSGVTDSPHIRLLLRDIGINPWRQASPKWWNVWSWYTTSFSPDQYASIGEERRSKW